MLSLLKHVPPSLVGVNPSSGWALPCFPYVVSKMSSTHKFFYLVVQGVAIFGGVAIVAMVVTIFA